MKEKLRIVVSDNSMNAILLLNGVKNLSNERLLSHPYGLEQLPVDVNTKLLIAMLEYSQIPK